MEELESQITSPYRNLLKPATLGRRTTTLFTVDNICMPTEREHIYAESYSIPISKLILHTLFAKLKGGGERHVLKRDLKKLVSSIQCLGMSQ